MIYGSLLPELVIKLNNSQFEFYLTGSRYFGTMRPDSDWDFFGDDTPEKRVFLKSLGFYPQDESEHQYIDDFKTVVYVNWQGPIHVQLIENVQWKVRTQTFLRMFPWSVIKDKKESAHIIWNWAKEQCK